VVPGPLVLFVSAPGHQSERVSLTTLPDQTTVADVPLSLATPPTGALVVRSNIPGALIKLDGQEAGFCPAVIENVPTGRRTVEIVEEGRKPYTSHVEIKRNERAFVDARLGKADPEITAATKSAASAETVPASISVVTADEIAAMGYRTLTQALESVRGTFTSNDRSYEAVGFRGFSPPGDYTNRVLVLVDGHATNDLVTGQGYVGHDLDVDLSNVARIEVVRGPGSVLYGTGALFGVINVVTKRPAEGVHGAVAMSTGSLGLMSGRATLSARAGRAEILLSAALMEAANDYRYTWDPTWYAAWLATRPPGTATPVLLNNDGERAKHADLVARLGAFSLRAGYNERWKEVPSGAYQTDPLSGTTHFDHRAFADLRFEQAFGGLRVAVRGAYDASWYQGHYQYLEDNGGVSGETLAAQWVTGELRLELPEFLHQRITVGSEVSYQLHLETALTETVIPRELIASGYLVDNVILHPLVRLNLGLRTDYYTQSFGAVLTPRLAFIVKPYRAGTTKFLAGRSFRAPSPNERANSETGDLQAEIILSGEVEHTHVLNDDLRIVGSVFASDLTNLIYVPPAEALSSLFANQAHKIRGYGAESELRWEPGGGTLVSLSTTYQRVIVYEEDASHPYTNSPRTLVKARGLVPLMGPVLRVGAELFLDSGRHFGQGRGLQDDRVDDAILCNLSLSGEYRPFRLRYYGGLFNLFNVQDYRTGYPTSVEYWAPAVPRYGRALQAGLSVGF
jgi:outer membrane receptor for ferrienterochelin and colicins